MTNKHDNDRIMKIILENGVSIDDIEEDMIHELISGKVAKDINQVHKDKQTLGQRAADKISDFVGSWTFIIIAISCIILWVIINVVNIFVHFDPYPFILLNLFLSCTAAIQAPIIMMAQNRQEEKDRLRAKNDYKVNLKSEIIVEDLHNKMDCIMSNQEEILKRLRALEK